VKEVMAELSAVLTAGKTTPFMQSRVQSYSRESSSYIESWK